MNNAKLAGLTPIIILITSSLGVVAAALTRPVCSRDCVMSFMALGAIAGAMIGLVISLCLLSLMQSKERDSLREERKSLQDSWERNASESNRRYWQEE